ncbi:hypothetical protein BDP67DRAFT_489556 [Colletotrichum lupini]|nr:hypothetical protein BDP67DRAFT_489556 [Colletotrichum lupini]
MIKVLVIKLIPENGGGGKENNVTEDSPRRGETNESGAQSLPNKTQEHRVLVPAVAASKPHRQSGSGHGDLPPHLASHLVRICGHQMTPRYGSAAAAVRNRETWRVQGMRGYQQPSVSLLPLGGKTTHLELRRSRHNGEVDLENSGGVCRTVDRRPKNGCQRRFAIFGNSVKGESGPLHLVFANPRAQCSPCPGSRPARREGMGEDSPGDAAGGGVVPDRKCSPAATIINRVEDVWYQTARYDQDVFERLGGQFGGSKVRRQHGLPHQPIHRQDVEACFPSDGGGEFISRVLLDDDSLRLLLVNMVNRALATATATLRIAPGHMSLLASTRSDASISDPKKLGKCTMHLFCSPYCHTPFHVMSSVPVIALTIFKEHFQSLDCAGDDGLKVVV